MKRMLLIALLLQGFCYHTIAQTDDEEIVFLTRLFNNVDIITPIDDERYLSMPAGEFNHSQILNIPESTQADLLHKVLIIVDSTLYVDLKYEIDRYAYDIHHVYGCNLIMEWVDDETYQDIKSLILSYQSGLDGCVFFGDIVPAQYEAFDLASDTTFKNWPSDLYYMDLTGIWTDTTNNHVFDVYSGDMKPEIFIGRISTTNMGHLLDEVEGMRMYLNKNHKYWIGHQHIEKKSGLAYTNNDWKDNSKFTDSILFLYGNGNYNSFTSDNLTSFGREDYLNRLGDSDYEFIQLASHSNYDYHCKFGRLGNEYIYGNEVFNHEIQALGFNLFCCYACRWISASNTRAFLAGDYIYTPNSKGLCVVGSTKSGSMYPFTNFYKSLGQRKTMGQALVDWWRKKIPYYHDLELCWFSGLTIIGDPLVNFFHCTNSTCQDQISLNSYNSSNSPLSYYLASESITIAPTTGSFTIPIGDHCIFNAPTVEINGEFLCPQGSSMEILNEGCRDNCDE